MNELTGVILAGGKSSRFGSAKYLAKIGEKTLLDVSIQKLSPSCSEIIIVSKDRINSPPLSASNFVRNVLEDGSFFHPLIGIKTGLKASNTDANLVIAADMPFISQELIKSLLSCKSEVCLYKYKECLEPLFGLYKKGCLPVINDFISSLNSQPSTLSPIKRRIIDIIELCNHKYIDIEDKRLDFFNINTKEDLDEARRLIKSNPELLRT